MLLLTSVSSIAQDAPEKIDRPMYEDLGISSTTLFLIMLVLTIVLLFALFTVAKGASTVLKQNAEKLKKAGMVIAFAIISTNSGEAADTVELKEETAGTRGACGSRTFRVGPVIAYKSDKCEVVPRTKL